ncbi:MAG: GyrI-like domain-containing protein [Candidatus Izemoplasmatales bacterium]|nr:GyrI-like domain-containing protein [Candidatus Izemoplasmatales bacterium]
MEKPVISIKNNISMKVIYLSFKGNYIEFRKNSQSMYENLFKFAIANNLLRGEKNLIMTIYHDNPFITKVDELNTSVAMTIEDGLIIPEDNLIKSMVISGNFAIARFNLRLNDYGEAWGYIYKDWLFNSQYVPRNSFPFEMYITKPPRNFKDTSVTDIYIPIE